MKDLVPMCRRCALSFQEELTNITLLHGVLCDSCGQDAETAVPGQEVPKGASLCLSRGFHVSTINKPCRDCGESSPEVIPTRRRTA